MENSSASKLHVKKSLSIQLNEENLQIDDSENEPIVHKRRRRNQQRLVAVTLWDLSQAAGEDLNALLNSAEANRNLYQRFKEQLVLEGINKWRHHDDNKDVCILQITMQQMEILFQEVLFMLHGSMIRTESR